MQNKIYKGVKNTWIETANYSTAEYKLLLSIQHPSESSSVEFGSTVENDQFKFEIIPSESERLKEGYCIYNIRAISLDPQKADDVFFVGSGVVDVVPDTVSSTSDITFALQMVNKLRAVILSLSSKTTSTITIDGDSYSYQDLEKITKQLHYWELRAGVKKQPKVLARFVNE